MRALVFVACLTTPCLTSCSLFAPSTQSVAITATDPAAEIFINGSLAGKGAATVDLRRNKSHAILAKVGDRAGTATIGNSISTTGVLDIVGGLFFLVPLIGIAGPGFWSLDNTEIVIAIPPASASN